MMKKKKLQKLVDTALAFDVDKYMNWYKLAFVDSLDKPIYPSIPKDYFEQKFSECPSQEVIEFDKAREVFDKEQFVFKKRFGEIEANRNAWSVCADMDKDRLYDLADYLVLQSLVSNGFADKVKAFKELINLEIRTLSNNIDEAINDNIELIDFKLIEWCGGLRPLSIKRHRITALTTFVAVKMVAYLVQVRTDLERKDIEPKSDIDLKLNKKLQWTGNNLELITHFYQLLEYGFIKGTKKDIERLIMGAFTNCEGEEFKQSYIVKHLKPIEDKAKNKADFTEWLKKIGKPVPSMD